ncbi:helix-turn-helix domain-containing protein [Jiulongibacter sediminis]|uniref:AraC family transcriptional regulator n=1 Tax=Jiulongibacter sediminis TaxID=1605367 RepID=A0A0P7BWW8_9BACT|nr:AraC family transcriptional regulator [Jiulongibacter sediminis]KPM49103.1 AraC family transcriptional regulator [Jiulongibacter sediminis]TBX26161.1 AraC family transcriptional regulator [Jiulongibacter sediminis]
MPIQNVPEVFLNQDTPKPEILVYDFKMSNDVFKTKVNLSQHMFSFLQNGRKEIHFADSSVMVDMGQSLLVKKGNWLWSEMLVENSDLYYCKLLFFSDKQLRNFLDKTCIKKRPSRRSEAYFIIENDLYIHSYLNSLSAINSSATTRAHDMNSVKLEELLLYLLNKYDKKFEDYLFSLISPHTSDFSRVIEQNIFANLKIEELAFLCHMSLSTFKRHFFNEYGVAPGKYFQDQRLQRAKAILEEGKLKSTDIYLDFGYKNLSNFSAAFKKKFGYSPNQLKKP